MFVQFGLLNSPNTVNKSVYQQIIILYVKMIRNFCNITLLTFVITKWKRKILIHLILCFGLKM